MRRLVLLAAVLGMASSSSQADVTIYINQVGSDVVATGSGSLDITDLTYNPGALSSPGVIPNQGVIEEGPLAVATSYYTAVTGPTAFGTSGQSLPTFGSGDEFGISGWNHTLVLPTSYVTGTSLSSSDTYSGQTISSLGLTPGTYTWTWGTGAHADSLTVQIGPATTAVPEPSTAIVAVLGAVAFITYGWSRRRRQQRRQVSA